MWQVLMVHLQGSTQREIITRKLQILSYIIVAANEQHVLRT